jgi:hypothetical protein
VRDEKLKRKHLEDAVCYVKSEVLTAVKMSMLFFWVITPCGLASRYQRFGGTYCVHLQG